MGFNLEKNYVERTDIHEFLHDHPVMIEVYVAVRRFCKQKEISKQRLIDILNCTYKICTIATSQEGTIADVKRLRGKYRPDDVYLGAVSTAFCLLKLHQGGKVYVSGDTVRFLGYFGRKYGMVNYFETIICNYAKDFEAVINFSGKAIVQSEEATAEQDSAIELLPAQENVIEDGDQHLKQNETLPKQLEEEKNRVERLSLQEFEVLQKNLQEIETKYEAECRSHKQSDVLHQQQSKEARQKIEELEDQINRLNAQVSKLEHELSEEKRVFSLKHLVTYALSLPTDEEAKAVVKLLRECCWYNRFMDSKVMTIIDLIMPQRQEAQEKKKAHQQVVAGPTNYNYHIHQVGQLNPVATEINNQYERSDYLDK